MLMTHYVERIASDFNDRKRDRFSKLKSSKHFVRDEFDIGI